VEVFEVILSTESPRDSKRQLRTVTWPIHRSNCRRNHRGIQTRISIQWRDLFTVRRWVRWQKLIYDHSVVPFLPYFSFFPIPTLPYCKQPAPPKKKYPSSQHNKSYFLKFCGHNIHFLIYRWILSVFVSNFIFLNFNI
jgi:hypothetical protein